ncbi:hypothetical protein [uncultured Pseudomonas sp.]|uniref:hypothetical protein n=1 Tax=uncultured Pseudomonas sp. TaxID=114707 RepID=UPI0025829F77|nr:hypothetical protein [uncultured Pseudomonas sp.]
MRSSANDIPPWLASLSDRTLRRLNSRLTHLLRMIDVEMQHRDEALPPFEVRGIVSRDDEPADHKN